MPIPRIPYIDYEDVLNTNVLDEKPIWIDIYERLYKERVLFLCKEIQTPFVNRFIALLLLMTSEPEDIYIYMN